MTIDYFLKNYQAGNCFFSIRREDITERVKGLDWKSYYVYLLCIDGEIVYVGYSGVIRERIKLHADIFVLTQFILQKSRIAKT